MAVERLSEDIIYVELPAAGSQIAEELTTVSEMVSEECTSHVILDFFRVEVLNSWNISTLLALQSLVHDANHHLILCNVRVITKCIFVVAGLRKTFTFAADKDAAVTMLDKSNSPHRVH